MKKIYETVEIRTWKKIAYMVQKLKFLDGTEEEFQENLVALNVMLQKLGFEDNIGKREPETANEIGTSTLLHLIQDINVPNHYKNIRFYEKILQLSDLGVELIDFCPVADFSRLPDLVKKNLKKSIILQKCYTDGMFQLQETTIGNTYVYNLHNLRNANYVLITTLKQSLTAKKRYSITQKESQVILKNFNGVFPSKKEIMKPEFPELVTSKQSIKWGEPPKTKEKFETFNSEVPSYQKQLKKMSIITMKKM